MNKQYKVIWSKVRHCYVVVSELAKRSGKTKSVKARSCQKLAVTLTVLALSLGMTGMVGAANNTAGSGSGVAVGAGSSAEFDTSVAVGQNATATLANSTAIGQGATVSQSASGGTAIGQGATVNVSGGVALGAGSVANVGLGGRVYEPSGTKVGFPDLISPAWMARTYGAVSIGVTDANGVASETRRIVGLAAGSQDTDAVNVAQLKLLDSKVNSIKTTYFAVKSTDTENQTNNGAFGDDSIAIGPSAKAKWDNALAIGKSAIAATDGGVALGSNSYNIVTSKIRGYIPTSVTLTEEQQTTPTWRATMGAVAIGITAKDSTGAITTATGTRQIVGLAAGTQDTDAVNVAQLKAVNDKVDANKISFVSIKETSRGENDNKDNDGATGDDGIAIGVFAAATAPNTTAMGQKAKATNYNAIALGDFANASGIGSTAVGDYAIASSHSTVAVGSDANATGKESIAIGHTAKGTGYQATSVGSESTASGINALSVGFGSSAKGQFGGAFGSAAAADGDFATAAGYGANATANSATALGENSTASIEGGVALGSYSKTNVNSGVLGYDPSDKITTQEILLGDNKTTYDNLQNEIATAQTNVSTLAQQILDLQTEYETADDTRRTEIVNEIKSLNTQFLAARSDLQDKESAANKLVSTWQATGAAVSVGNSETGLTRQITNVAAGSEDTDAVNVAQLTSLSDKVDANKISYVSINTKRDANKDNDQAGIADNSFSKDSAVIGSNTITTGLGNWNLVATGFGNTIKDISYDATTDSVTEKLVNNTYVYGNENIAREGIVIGRRNILTGKSSSSSNIAIGFNNKNYGERSVNLGNSTLTNGVDSIAVGFSAKAPKTDAIAVGGAAQANQVGSIAIGQGAVANTGGLALGYNSLADRSQGSIGYFTTLGSTEQAAIAEKMGKTDEYNQLVTTINGYSNLADQESQYRSYISERQKNEDLLSAEIENLYNNPEGSAKYNASLAKIREYQQKIKENNDGENSLSSIVSTNNPDYVKLLAARTELRNMFAAYMSTADAVSVGNVEKGIYRQITGVAAGSEDTDAVNVAQLKDVGTTGLNFKGDGDTVVHRDLGATLNVVGGNTDSDSLTDNNIGVVADDTKGILNVKLAKDLTGLNSVKVGDSVTLDASGLTITGGPSVTTVGINAGSQKITNVADGEANTDAVNVAQLKANKVTLTEGDNVTITSDVADDGSTNYTIKSTDTNTILSSGKVTYSGADGTLVLTDSTGKDVTVKGLKNTYLTGASLSNNTLTLNQNEGSPITVTGLATTTDIANNKIRYFSVNSTKTANENNDGATGEDAIAVGPNAIATNKHGIAIGNEVIVNGQEAIGIGSGIEPQYGKTIEKAPSYGSIAIGNKSWVDGKSERATVVGFNSVIQNSNRAVSLGSISFVDRSEAGVAIGYRSIITTSPFGVAIGSNDLGLFNSERGVVIGSNVFLNNSKNSILIGADSKTMDGQESSIGIGTTVKVKGDNSIAMGSSASVMAESSMALGNRAKATESGGVAIGAYSVADRGALESGYNPTTDTTNGKIEDDATLAQAWGIQDKYSAALNKINSTEEGSEERTAAEKAMNELLSPYRSGYSAVSVGTSENTRQIINVAAGQADTDAVNVAQLKAAKVEVVAGTNIKTIAADTSEGYTKYTVNAIDTKVMDGTAKYEKDGTGSITLNTDVNGEKDTVTVSGLADTYTTGGTYDADSKKVTFTQNDSDKKYEVDLSGLVSGITEGIDKGLNFAGDSGDTINKKLDQKLDIVGGATDVSTGSNIGVISEGGKLNVRLAKELTGLNSVKVGDAVTLGTTGLTIANGPSMTTEGINAGNKKITNVADGVNSTDAVNVSQLKANKVTVAAGANVTVGTANAADGSTTYTVASKDTYTTEGTYDKDSKKIKFTQNDTDKNYEVDMSGLVNGITEGIDKGLNFAGDSGDAINKKLGQTLSIVGGADKDKLTEDNIGVVSDNGALKIKLAQDLQGLGSVRIGGTTADGKGIYIAKQTVTYTKDGQDGETVEGRFITGLENQEWDPDNKGIVSGRAATEDQLKAAYDSISSNVNANKVVAGKNIEVTPDKNGNGTTVALKDTITLGSETADKQVNINGDAATITAGDGANKVAIDGSKAAITAGEGANQVAIDGTKAAITAGEGANQVAIDGTNATVTAGTGANKVAIDGTKGQVTIGEAGKGLVMGNQEVAVKNADGTPKVDADGKPVTENGKFITGLDNTTWNPAEKGYVPDRAATEGQLKSVSDSVKNVTDTIGVGKRDFVGDETADDKKVGVKLGESLNLKGGADVSKLSDGNIGVVTNKDKNGFDIKLSKDLKGLNSVETNSVTTKELTVTEKANIGNVSISNDNVTIGTGDSKTVITNEAVTTGSVTTGNTTINNDGLTVKNEDSSKNITVQNNNVSMGGNVVHNVGDGVEATDAINKGQFDRTVNAIGTGMNQMSNRISKLDTRVDRVGAGAAALAALHPLEYNADEKWEISAGVGNYRGANAVAVGAFYRPNGNTLVSLGTSYGGGENMVNAGVTWRVGEGETGNYSSKQAMAQEISSLKSVVSDQSSQLQAQNSKIEAQSQQLEEQNKKIEQLMQAIAELKK